MFHSTKNILFLDIETVSCVASFEDLKEPLATFWLKKATFLGASNEKEQQSFFFEKAGIFAEFGKIIVIGLGYFESNDQGIQKLYVKGLSNHDEKQLLEDFKHYLLNFPLFKKINSSSTLQLCGHNIKEFDIPYLCRRMTINNISLPKILDTAGKKPWEVNHIDTMELWKFGDRKNFTSLELLTHLFNIPSSKSLMQNHEVNKYYHLKKDLATIQKYCQQDIIATARLFCKMNFLTLPTSIVLQ